MNALTENYLQDLLELEDNEELPEEIIKKDRNQQNKRESNLLNGKEFNSHVKKLDRYIEKNEIFDKIENFRALNDEEHLLISKSTDYIRVIDREINNIHKLIKVIYLSKFPELETIILNPIEYVKCIVGIQNKTDLININLPSILTPHTITAVILEGSSTRSKPLPETDLTRVFEACELPIQYLAHIEQLV